MPPTVSRTFARTRLPGHSELPNLPIDLDLPEFERQLPSCSTDYCSLEHEQIRFDVYATALFWLDREGRYNQKHHDSIHVCSTMKVL